MGAVIGTCAVVMAVCAGCDESVNDSGESSESTVCNAVGTTWWNQGFSEQTGTFHVEFVATPSAENIDAVLGLSNGAATKWTSLAAIVRFNPDGYIDARNGSTYTAVQPWRYSAGATYYVRIDVDMQRRTYSAWASYQQGSYGSWNQVAANYAFRTEQASVTKLNNLSGFVNPETGPAGTVQVCGFALNTVPTTGSGCVATSAGGGFLNIATSPGVNSMIVNVGGVPSLSNMDGVIGVSSGPADEYNDLAAAIRFYTNGRVEARDGDSYRADTVLTYAPGESFSFVFVIDLANKTYSVYAYPQGGDVRPVELARNYRFRPQQVGVTSLDHVASIVASSTGRVDVCGARSSLQPNLRYVRVGQPRLAAFAGGVIVSDGTSTQKLDANGKVVATLAVGGLPAVDSSGNVYLARGNGTSFTIDAFSSSLARRWSRTITDSEGGVAGIAAAGNIVYVVYRRTAGDGYIYAFSPPDGEFGISDYFTADTVVGVSGGGFAEAVPHYDSNGYIAGYSISSTGYSDQLFSRDFTGSFVINTIAHGPDGSVVFGGTFYGYDVNFGDRTFYPGGNNEEGPFNAYFVALDSSGALRYSAQTGGSDIEDIDYDGSSIAVSNFHWTQFPWVHFGVYDTAGNTLSGCSECDVGLGHQGFGREIAVSSHRVYLNVDEHVWWESSRVTFPFTLAFDF